ncbi:MAG: AMP-binding protein [Spirochaetaceae bacterium]|jgi:long-chain acyl-CoA synthetase|nr:AMP-binding protein [Spirochaetaceae bacterium]
MSISKTPVVQPQYDMPYQNFIEWLDAREAFAEKPAILFRGGKQKAFTVWTYRRFIDTCRRIARGLLAAGLRKGDRVVLWAENRPEWMAVWMGAVIAGCVIVPVDFFISEEECLNIIKFTKSRAGFFSSRKASFAAAVRSTELALVTPISGEGFENFGRDASGQGQKIPTADALTGDDPCSIVFTSGTTGFAKGVMLRHRGIIANASAAIVMLKPRLEDTFINVLPLHHTYPTTCSFFAPFSCGIPTIVVERLAGPVVVDDIRDGHGTFLIAVPLLYDKFMAAIESKYNALPFFVRLPLDVLRAIALSKAKQGNPDFGRKVFRFLRKKAGLESINIMVAGGGALNPKTADFFDSLGFNIVHGYGMSENSPLISVSSPEKKNNYSVGLPVRFTDVRIVDQNDDTKELAVGESGEIIVKSPSLMLGYYEKPQETAEMFTAEGFLKTGDLGYIDQKGFIFINGRKKNLIVSSGGKNIYPEEIEAHFHGSRVIGEILVLGRREDEAGEAVFAVIYPHHEALKEDYAEGAATSAFVYQLVKKEIERVNRALPAYKKISGFMLRDHEFEKNAQKKIRRFLYKDYEDPAKTPIIEE